jgi:hypothetical protein
MASLRRHNETAWAPFCADGDLGQHPDQRLRLLAEQPAGATIHDEVSSLVSSPKVCFEGG